MGGDSVTDAKTDSRDGRDRLSRWRLVLGGHEADGIVTDGGQSVDALGR